MTATTTDISEKSNAERLQIRKERLALLRSKGIHHWHEHFGLLGTVCNFR